MATTTKKTARNVRNVKQSKSSAATSKGSTTNSTPPRLSIRMYRHGLGDCLLLRFAKAEGGTFNLVIDCGLVMAATDAKKKMVKVAQDIDQACGGHIDVIVMTHEHWDHASGFSKDQARAVFDGITVGEVWYGWTEDPQNELGRTLRKERAEKVRALALAVAAFSNAAEPAIQLRGKQLGAFLGFFGLEPETDLSVTSGIGRTRGAFEYLMQRRGVKTRFLYPSKAPLSLRGVPNVRVYVLGPPEDESYIKKSTPSKMHSEVYEVGADFSFTAGLASAFSRFRQANSVNDDDCPFDSSFRQTTTGSRHRGVVSPALAQLVQDTWDKPGEEWRLIRDDWTQAAETLALNLDSHTNNTCVVLAFEFCDTGEVFLFPADAQVGNWLSWQDLSWNIKGESGMAKIVVSDLLSRTVFYKVGHHGSHNATLRELGLEQMTSDELIAFIPVVEAEAQKNRWMNMPFKPLLNRLEDRTGGRMLRSDHAAPTAQQLSELPAISRGAFLKRLNKTDLYFEYAYK
ncbi:MAG: MBL fold metallo-hydrolase [Sulfuritalea sp.]|nr:MBL fold metallo-hydrolase [Sulfuritalea sp.]